MCLILGQRRRLTARVIVVVFAVLVVAACGESGPVASGRVIVVNARDFHLSVGGEARVRAGVVTFAVRNTGAARHELLVARPLTRLPLRRDGVTVNEEQLIHSHFDGTDPVEPGGTASLRVRLVPGHYVLFCNMAGHYLGGMHQALVVV